MKKFFIYTFQVLTIVRYGYEDSVCIAQNYRSFLPWFKLDISELDIMNKSKAFSLWVLKGFPCLGKWKRMKKALERKDSGGGDHLIEVEFTY